MKPYMREIKRLVLLKKVSNYSWHDSIFNLSDEIIEIITKKEGTEKRVQNAEM